MLKQEPEAVPDIWAPAVEEAGGEQPTKYEVLRDMAVTLKSVDRRGGPMRFSDGWPADERTGFIVKARELHHILERWEDEFPAGTG